MVVVVVMDQVSLDHIGLLQRITNSRWAKAYPFSPYDADLCARSLHNGLLAHFLYSRMLHSDRDSTSISGLMIELSVLGQCKQTLSESSSNG